jgi:hypothetical protein
MQCIYAILLFVVCLTLQNFCTLSNKRQDFRKMLINLKNMFRFSLQLTSETFLLLRKNQRGIFISVYRSSSNVSVVPVRF